MINPTEFQSWMNAGQIPETMGMAFNGADAGVSSACSAAFVSLNRAFKHYAAVTADKTLSPGERARSLKAGQAYIDRELTKAMSEAKTRADYFATQVSQEREKFVTGSLSDEFALSLAVQLRSFGNDAASVAMTDPRFVQALNRVPAAVAGLKTERVAQLTEAAIQQNAPELAARLESVKAGQATYERLERVAMELATRVSRAIDPAALARQNEITDLLKVG